MSAYRHLFGLMVLITISTAATTKSWQHSDKMKEMESSRASIPLKKNKISDKLAHFDTVQPTQSMSSKVGGFENHSSETRRKAAAPAAIQVNNKLDKIHSAKSFVDVEENLPKYDLGPGINLTLDVPREIVNVNLDEDYLKDIFQGKLMGKRC